MIRAYALALGAGTQVLTVGLGEPVLGSGAVVHDLLMTAAWVVNLAVAERIIRRPVRRPWRVRPVGAVGAVRSVGAGT